MKCFNCNKFIPEVSTVCPYCNQDLSQKTEINFGDINDTDYDQKFDIKTYVKEPKNRKNVLIGVGIILFVIIIFIALIMMLFGGKKQIPSLMFPKTVETFFDYFIDNFTGSSSSKTGEYELEVNINNDGTKLDGIYGIDTKNKIISLTGKMRDPRESTGEIILDNKDFVFSSYLKENSLYFQSNQIYNNGEGILLPLEDNYGFLTTKNYDLSTLLSGISYAIQDSLKEMNYYSAKEKIEYRGEKIKLNKSYFVLNNQAKKKFLEKFYKTLIDDSNFLNEVARLRDTSSSEVEKILNNYLTTSEYKYNGESDYETVISIYYKGMKLYRIEVDMNEKVKQRFTLDIGDTKYYLDFYKGNEKIYYATLVAITKEKEDYINKIYEFTYESDGVDIDATLDIKDDKSALVKKQEINNYKNIRDFSVEDYNNLKNNLNYYMKDVSWVDDLDELFKNKCSPDLKCICEDNECKCTYGTEIIICTKDEITPKTN